LNGKDTYQICLLEQATDNNKDHGKDKKAPGGPGAMGA